MWPKSRSRAIFWTASLFILLLYLIHFVWQVSKNPLRLDEVDYYQCMENVQRLGLPLYYAGEVNIDPDHLMYLSTRYLDGQEFVFWRFKPETGILKETFFALVEGTSRYTFGMWHPPLYIYLGSLAFRLLPLTPASSHLLRYFNLIFSIGIFIGMLALSRKLYPDKHRQVFLIALILYTLNSLAVRGSILIDYNATLGPCVAIWFVAIYLSEQEQRFPWKFALLTALAFFTSLGIAVNLVIGTLIYVLLAGRDQRPWRTTAAIVAGTAGFLLTFLIFCRISRLPFSQPFLHNISRLDAQVTLAWLINQVHTAVRYTQIYSEEIGLPIVITIAGLCLKTICTKEVCRAPKRGYLPVMLITGLTSHAALGAEAYGFIKYILFLLPLLFVYLAGEELILLYDASRLWKALAVVTLALIVWASAANSLQMMRLPGGTLYDKGAQGTVAIAQRLEVVSNPDAIILSDKDVAFFAQRKFVQWSRTYLTDIESLRTRVAEEGIRYTVINSNTLAVFPELSAYLNDEFLVQDRIGSYVLLRRKDR